MMARPKIGRNDPCWCGSGRKLKKCHGTTDRGRPQENAYHLTPENRPTPIVTHLEGQGEQWVERPGLLAVSVVTEDPADIDADLKKLRTGWGEWLRTAHLPPGHSQALASRLNDIQHKLQGVRYHRDNFVRRESEVHQNIAASAPPTGVEMRQKYPGLVFEAEACLYQIKSTLDMLAQLLRDAGFQSVGDSFGDHGERIIRQLEHPPKPCADEARALVDLVTAAQTAWIDQVIAMRDYIAHCGMLDSIGSFAQSPYVCGTSATLTYPHLPTGERVTAYIERVEQCLRSFVEQFVAQALRCSTKLTVPKSNAG